ncbi:MAG: phosphoribosyltransferase [Rudaea sp.]
MLLFRDRFDAGERLAAVLSRFRGQTDLVVLGIPRGGVLVAYEVACTLAAPLDVWITHKLGAPFNPELAVGAVCGDGTTYYDYDLMREFGFTERALEPVREEKMHEVQRQEELYRRGRPPLRLADKTVILIDDGVATGSTTIAALRALSLQAPKKRILAVPVAPVQSARLIARECDEMVVLGSPEPFIAVGRFYRDFTQVSDQAVVALLAAVPRPTGE